MICRRSCTCRYCQGHTSFIAFIDTFWGYALSNKWDYFITLTCDPKKVNRYNYNDVESIWRVCRQRMQRFDKDVRILLIPEQHKDGAWHYHGLVGMDRQFTLGLHTIDGKQQYSATGAPLFEFPFWDFGIASCAIVETGDYLFNGENLTDICGNYTTSQRRVVAYLSKYVGKQFGAVDYQKKRYFHTNNLKFKNKEVLNLNPDNLLNQYGVTISNVGNECEANEGKEFKVTMGSECKLYEYKQDKHGRIYFRTKSETRDEHDVMGVLVLAAGGMTYRPLEELEAMTASGAAELIGENCQYKYFREVVK